MALPSESLGMRDMGMPTARAGMGTSLGAEGQQTMPKSKTGTYCGVRPHTPPLPSPKCLRGAWS